MVEQRECLIDFIFMYYCYIWPSKGFSRCAVFFPEPCCFVCLSEQGSLETTLCCHQLLHRIFPKKWFTKCMVKKDCTCPHCRRVVRAFFFLILFIYFPINGAERYNDAKTSLECGMNPQMHGTTPSLKRLWVDIYQPTFGIFVILRSDFLFLLLIHLPDKKSLYVWHLLLVAVGNVSHAVN